LLLIVLPALLLLLLIVLPALLLLLFTVLPALPLLLEGAPAMWASLTRKAEQWTALKQLEC
jgi:hypothetical protein